MASLLAMTKLIYIFFLYHSGYGIKNLTEINSFHIYHFMGAMIFTVKPVDVNHGGRWRDFFHFVEKYQATHAIILHFFNIEAYSDSGG